MIQDIPLIERFKPQDLEQHEKEIIVGALCTCGVGNPLLPTVETLTAFTWEQVLQALQASRQKSFGDALDNIDDTIYAVRDARKSYVQH